MMRSSYQFLSNITETQQHGSKRITNSTVNRIELRKMMQEWYGSFINKSNKTQHNVTRGRKPLGTRLLRSCIKETLVVVAF